METKHTPGPWKIGYGGQDGDDYAVITARLTASAPDLLAALEEIKRNVELWKTADNMAGRLFEITDRAIAKATKATK